MSVNPAQLQMMRAAYDRTLQRTCSIPGAGTTTNNGDGTWTETTAAAMAGVKCSFMAAAGNERTIGGAVARIGNYILRIESGIALTPSMTVVVDALNGTHEGRARTFQLVAPLDSSLMVGQRWLATEG